MMELSTPKVATSNILSLVADRCNCYVGELVTLFMRFTVPDQPGAVLQLSLPKVIEVESYRLPEGILSSSLSLVEVNQEFILMLPLKEPFMRGESYEIEVRFRIKTFHLNQYLLCEAEMYDGETSLLAYEAVQTAVISQGSYLRHLPEIYERDDFVNHFLMLIEGFWKPISQQIDQMDCYFDPYLTPPLFLPWLASWLGLPVDNSLPLERMRALLKSAMLFYQQRGTFQALKTYLETYTGGEVVVVERRARNFIVGEQCRLGVEVALGKKNQPNSLQVAIRMPSEELEQAKFSAEMYQRKIKEIVHSLVPAHTVFDVQCEFIEKDNDVMTKGI